MTDTEKVAKAKWKKKMDANDETAGDEPVKNWHLSIDYYADSDDDSSDKQKFLEDTSFSFGDDVSPAVGQGCYNFIIAGQIQCYHMFVFMIL